MASAVSIIIFISDISNSSVSFVIFEVVFVYIFFYLILFYFIIQMYKILSYILGDPIDFLSWFLNSLHMALNGTKKPNSSIIYKSFLGHMRIYTR